MRHRHIAVVLSLAITACAGPTAQPPHKAAPPAAQITQSLPSLDSTIADTSPSEIHQQRKDKKAANNVEFKAPLKEELLLVDRLLNTSSAARQIQDSDNPTAMALYQTAHERFRAAKDTSEEQARRLLAQAKTLLFRSLRSATATQPQETAEHYISLRNSTQALLQAHTRIRKEKPSRESQMHERDARQGLAKAEQLFTAGNTAQAVDVLKQAFHRLRASLMAMRQGETLIRRLSFATPADEFHYEVKRYRSHRLLVDLLLGKKDLDPGTQKRVQQSLDSAARLRQRAEQEAGVQSHTQAIKTLEGATRQLLRAIREAGIYIPG
jgi:hypothetical protein